MTETTNLCAAYPTARMFYPNKSNELPQCIPDLVQRRGTTAYLALQAIIFERYSSISFPTNLQKADSHARYDIHNTPFLHRDLRNPTNSHRHEAKGIVIPPAYEDTSVSH